MARLTPWPSASSSSPIRTCRRASPRMPRSTSRTTPLSMRRAVRVIQTIRFSMRLWQCERETLRQAGKPLKPRRVKREAMAQGLGLALESCMSWQAHLWLVFGHGRSLARFDEPVRLAQKSLAAAESFGRESQDEYRGPPFLGMIGAAEAAEPLGQRLDHQAQAIAFMAVIDAANRQDGAASLHHMGIVGGIAFTIEQPFARKRCSGIAHARAHRRRGDRR